jgi:pimeloyl-ACP methyl ester carboxylesterase
MPHVPVNGVTLFCDLTGPEGAPVIAFSNSIGTTLEMWDAQARALSGRYRVLRYDTRGHGRSELAEQPVTIDDLADDLAGLLNALGVERAHVVGLSLGGMTADSLGSRWPHAGRSASRASCCGYVRLSALRLGGARGDCARGRNGCDRGRGGGALVHARIPARPSGGSRAIARAVPRNGPARLCRLLPRNRRHGPARKQCRHRRLDTNPPRADDPATLVGMMEEIRTRVPEAEPVVIPRAAHILAVERADAVNRHLGAFLDALGGAPQTRGGGVSFEQGLGRRLRRRARRQCRLPLGEGGTRSGAGVKTAGWRGGHAGQGGTHEP